MRRFAHTIFALSVVLGCAKDAPRQRELPIAPGRSPAASVSSALPSAVATPAALRSRLTYATLTLGGGEQDPLPWIVALHGLGDTPSSFVHVLARSSIRAHVYAPRALYAYGDGFDWYRERVEGDPERLAQAMRRAMDEVLAFVDDRAGESRNVGKPVVLGFSQGGMLSFALAVHHPERFRLAIPIGGLLPKPLWPTSKPKTSVPIVALHGTADPVVPIARTRALSEQLERLGYDATLLEFEGVQHGIPPEERGRLFEILNSELGE